MFDANAAHIKCGQLFFAEIHSVDSQLEAMGVQFGDIVLVKHAEKSGERLRINASSAIYKSKDCQGEEWRHDKRNDDDWSWMVYSGRPDGSGFIHDKWKQKALAFLGGRWESKNDI